MGKNVLNFSTNWNNKLDSKYFTTIRASKNYINYNVLIVSYKNKAKVVKIIDAKMLKLSQLNDWICYLDAGYSLKDTIKILEKMYNFDHNIDDKVFYYYLIESITDWLDIPQSEINLDLY